MDVREHEFIIKVEDNHQAFNSYKLSLIITNTTINFWKPPENVELEEEESGTQNVTAYIKQISAMGVMMIQFNATMATGFNFSHLNDSNVDIYIDPADNRTYEPGSLNLTWHVIDY